MVLLRKKSGVGIGRILYDRIFFYAESTLK